MIRVCQVDWEGVEGRDDGMRVKVIEKCQILRTSYDSFVERSEKINKLNSNYSECLKVITHCLLGQQSHINASMPQCFKQQ